MKIVTKIIGLTVCLCALAACTNVYCPKPLGETPVVLKADDWEGHWMNSDGFMTIKVKNAEAGKFEIAWIEDQNLESFNVEVKTSGDWMFGSTVDNAKTLRYIWGRIKREGRQMVIWVPEVDKFKALVEKGILPGTVDEDGNVSLGELTVDHMKIITSEKHGVLFDWENPVVLIRMN